MQLASITPLILTYNEERNIERVLAGLDWARQIVVVDSGSTDATLSMLGNDPRVTVLTRPFDSFAAQCNFGLTQIRTEWVLSLDADYVCGDSFAREIETFSEDPGEAGFAAEFNYCIAGRPLRGTLYPPRTVLYRRERARYENDGHGHRVSITGPIGRLASPIRHDDRKPLSTWLRAQERYADRELEKLTASSRVEWSLADRLRRRKWIMPLATPFYCLIGKGLILDGWRGWFYAAQRTYFEILLALKLHDFDVTSRLSD